MTSSSSSAHDPHYSTHPIQQLLIPTPLLSSPIIGVLGSGSQSLFLPPSRPSDPDVPPLDPTCVNDSQPLLSTIQPHGPVVSNHPMTTCSKSGIFKPRQVLDLHAIMDSSSTIVEPTTFTQAQKSPHWRTTMCEEYNVLLHNSTWDLVLFHYTQNIIGCKWVF